MKPRASHPARKPRAAARSRSGRPATPRAPRAPSAPEAPVLPQVSSPPGVAPGLRDTGIEVIGHSAWGTHFCQLYETRQDLIDVLVPCFAAGLKHNEYCMWVTSPPLDADSFACALGRFRRSVVVC